MGYCMWQDRCFWMALRLISRWMLTRVAGSAVPSVVTSRWIVNTTRCTSSYIVHQNGSAFTATRNIRWCKNHGLQQCFRLNLHRGGYVFASVCWLVCLLVHELKIYQSYSCKIFWRVVGLGTRNYKLDPGTWNIPKIISIIAPAVTPNEFK